MLMGLDNGNYYEEDEEGTRKLRGKMRREPIT
jgi:hypothetical protein